MNPSTTFDPEIVFYYDRDCGFCEASATLLARISNAHVVGASPENQALPVEVRQHISAEAVAMTDTGAKSNRIFRYGHEAIGIVLRHAGKKSLFRCAGALLLFPLLRKLWSFIYRVIASNRQQISIAFGLNACNIATTQ
ncbi:DCC1-like thiol-disulfide oxidoreductase family protein [Corynebacterium sp.]|uniref:DCC1-like thiol-disulfide oxidoreductase family protein n=1 Tax=Corynebacterium sp. TaxID=1720 RepID=UPI0034A4CAC0